MLTQIATWWQALSHTDLVWLIIGLTGQALFCTRWLVQWLVTERRQRSTVPELFWYFSLAGGLLVLSYGIHRMDPVVILGQIGVLIYARNIFFIRRERQEQSTAAAGAAPFNS